MFRLITHSVLSSHHLSSRAFSYFLLAALFLPCAAAAQKSSPPAKSSVETLIREGKLDQASRDLQNTLQKNPTDVHALTLLGTVRRKQGNYKQAEALWVKAAQSDPNAIEPIENVAKLYAEEDRVGEAVRLYEALLGALPHNAKFQAELADFYQKQGKYQKSLDLAEAIPTNSRPDHLLVVIVADYIGLKSADALQKAVEDVVHRAPANPDLIPQLANVLLDHGMVPDAAELLRLAGKHQRVTANYLAALAKAQAMSGQSEQAQTTINKALQLDPKSRDALVVAGRLAGLKGNWPSAISLLQRAEKAAPPTHELLQNLVLACMRANDLMAAHNAALDLLEIQPESPDAALTMCAVLIRAAHWGEADPLIDKVLLERPGDKRALVAKGVVDYNLGRIDDAQKHLTSSLGEGSGDAEANYYLGLGGQTERRLTCRRELHGGFSEERPRQCQRDDRIGADLPGLRRCGKSQAGAGAGCQQNSQRFPDSLSARPRVQEAGAYRQSPRANGALPAAHRPPRCATACWPSDERAEIAPIKPRAASACK